MDEISRDVLTIEEVSSSVSKALKDLNKLKVLEQQGKIKVKEVSTLNPLYIEILDESVEEEVVNNPIVDVEDLE